MNGKYNILIFHLEKQILPSVLFSCREQTEAEGKLVHDEYPAETGLPQSVCLAWQSEWYMVNISH